MEILEDRIYLGETYTIGNLFVNGSYVCDTIEDVVRELNSEKDKVYSETAIPKGRYKVILSYSPHFKRVLPEILDVPYFKNIRIHAGNTEDDSAGCLIVGENKVKGKVINSKVTLEKLMKIITPAWEKKEPIYITIIEKHGFD